MSLTINRLLEIACDGTEDHLAPEERAEFNRFMRRARIRRPIEPQTETAAKRVRSVRTQHMSGQTESKSGNRRWRWIAVGSGMAASVAVATTLFAIGRARDAERTAEQIAVERDAAVARIATLEVELVQQRGGSRNLPLGSDHALRLTANKASTPVDWASTLANHYDARFTPEENLVQLEKVSGAVRAETTRMRRDKPTATAKEILDVLFKAWGKPKL